MHCGKQHGGECRKLTGGCYFCGSLDHIFRNCPERVRVTESGRGRVTSEPMMETSRTSVGSTLPRGRGRGRAATVGGAT